MERDWYIEETFKIILDMDMDSLLKMVNLNIEATGWMIIK